MLGILGGRWLDNKFDTEPVLVIVGLIVGIVVAFYSVYRMILPNIKKQKNGGNGGA